MIQAAKPAHSVLFIACSLTQPALGVSRHDPTILQRHHGLLLLQFRAAALL